MRKTIIIINIFIISNLVGQNNDYIANLIFNAQLLNLEINDSINLIKTIEKDSSLYNVIQNKKISDIIQIPYLVINDSCFIELDCNYRDRNLLYCIKPEKSKYKEFFLLTTDKKYYHLTYEAETFKNPKISEDLYLYEDFFKIKDIYKFKKYNLIRLNNDLVFFNKNKLYSFKKGKCISYHKKRKKMILHNHNFLDGCK